MDTLGEWCLVSLLLTRRVLVALPKRPTDPLYRLGWPDGGCWSDSAYLALFRLGSDSASLVDQSATALLFCMLTFSTPLAAAVASAGGVNLHRLPGNGSWPDLCFAEFFAQYVPLSYRTLVFILAASRWWFLTSA